MAARGQGWSRLSKVVRGWHVEVRDVDVSVLGEFQVLLLHEHGFNLIRQRVI